MDPFRKALYEKLTGDATLTALLHSPTSVFHKLAPEGSTPPYIVYSKLPGQLQWTFGGNPLRWPLWVIKGVDRGGSASTVEAIDARLEELLTDAPLNVEGYNLLYLRRETDMPEPIIADTGEQVHECGGIFRVAIEKQ